MEILNGAAQTTVFLNVDGSAGVDFTLSAGADFTPISGTNELPVVALKDLETKFGGTVGADVGISINAGATASLPPFFDQTVSVQLFSKTFPVFQVRGCGEADPLLGADYIPRNPLEIRR